MVLSDRAHFEILEKFNFLKGQQLIGKASITNQPPDDFVSEPHHLNNLQRGMYKPEGQKYLLSCKPTEDKNNYGTQIHFVPGNPFEFTSINLAPPSKEKDAQKETDIAAARFNMREHLPLGILHKVKTGVYNCLGLGIITAEREDGVFIIEPFEPDKIRKEYNLSPTATMYDVTEAFYMSKQRIGQDKFRASLLNRSDVCELCGLSAIYTKASHVKPWAVAENSERLDVKNGLLLCPNHDLLFDQGYISFDEEGRILISNLVTEVDRFLFGLMGEEKIDFDQEQQQYLEYHRIHIFKDTLY